MCVLHFAGEVQMMLSLAVETSEVAERLRAFLVALFSNGGKSLIGL